MRHLFPELPDEYSGDFSFGARTAGAELLHNILHRDDSYVHFLHGMGGTGKSTTLTAIANHHQIHDRFPRAVWFLALGQSADAADTLSSGLSELVSEVCGAEKADKVGRLFSLRNNQLSAIAHVSRQLVTFPVLLILDDVCMEEESSDSATNSQTPVSDLVRQLARVVNKEKGPMRLVFSSRDRFMTQRLQHVSVVESFLLDARSPAAKCIICKYAGFSSEDEISSLGAEAERAFLEVLEKCAGLPLALAVAGKNVRELVQCGIESKGHVWQAFRESLLQSSSELLADSSPTDPRQSITTVVESSLRTVSLTLGQQEQLDIRSRFFAFAVMKKQRLIPLECLPVLWNCSQNVANQIRKKLVRVHLVSVENERETRLHQVIQDYCLEKIRKEGMLKERHVHFLSKMYKQIWNPGLSQMDDSFEIRKWWSLTGSDDSLQKYARNNVFWHLVQAERLKEGFHLLLDFRWTRIRVHLSQSQNKVSGIEEDIELFINARHKPWKEEVRNGLTSIFEAFRLSTQYISANPKELEFQLYGRVAHQASQNKIVEQYIASLVKYAALPWFRPSHGVLQPVSDTIMRKASFEVTLECLHVIRNSDNVVVGGDLGFLALFNLSSARILRTFDGHDNSKFVNDVTVAEKDQIMFSAGKDKSIRRWCLSTAVQIGISTCTSVPRCIILTADESYLLAGLEDGSVSVLRAQNLTVMSSWHCHNGAVRVLRIAMCRDMVLTGGDDGKIRKWLVKSWNPFNIETEGNVLLEEQGQKARDISLFASEERAAIAVGFKVFVIDTISGNNLAEYKFDWKVLGVQVGPESECKKVYIGIEDGTTRLLEMDGNINGVGNAKTLTLARSHNSRICQMALSYDRKSIVSVSADKTLSILRCGRSPTNSSAHRREMHRLSNLAVFPDRTRVLFAWEYDPRGLSSFGSPTGLHLLNLEGSDSNSLMSRSGTRDAWKANSDIDSVMKSSDVESATTLVACRERALTAIAVSKNGRLVAVGTSDGEVLIFNPHDWSRTHCEDRRLRGRVVCVKFSPDSAFVAASCTESCVVVWKTDEDAAVNLPGQPDGERVWVVEFNCESTALVAIADKEPLRHATVHIWRNLKTGRVTYERHSLSSLMGLEYTSIGVAIYMEGARFVMRSERFHALGVFDFESRRRFLETENSEFMCELVRNHDNQCRSEKVSIAPFSSKIKYKDINDEFTLGTLESSQCHSFSPDQWMFHEASGQFVAGGVLRKLVSGTLIDRHPEVLNLPEVSFLLEDDDAIQRLDEVQKSDDFTFFISHAGPDKNDIALPLCGKLEERGKLSFVDIKGIQPGQNAPKRMQKAIQKAKVAIFIMSPEFAARKWPMKELIAFQKRVEEAEGNNGVAPELLPVYYRLTREECKDPNLLKFKTEDGHSLFHREGFCDLVRQEEMNWVTVHNALKKLAEQSGLKNRSGVRNRRVGDESDANAMRRESLLDEIVIHAMNAAERVEKQECRAQHTAGRCICC